MDYFSQNLIALQKRYPHTNWLNFFKDIKVLDRVVSKNGEPTIIYMDNYLHSSYNPTAEAQKNLTDLANNNLDVLLFLGLGLLYSVKEAKLLYPNVYFYLIENDKILLKTLFTYVNCLDLITDSKISWLYETIEAETLIKRFYHKKIYAIKSIVLRSLYQFNQAKYDLFINSINSYIKKHTTNLATLNSHGKVWQRNLDINLYLQNSLPYIEKIASCFKGLPALLIAAGSSLNYYLEDLQNLQQKMLLICVDTALPTLHALGIKPDFVVAIDSQFWNFRHLDNLYNLETIYITDLCFNHSFFKKRKTRPTFLIENLYAKKYDNRYLSHPASHLKSGGSVATVAFSLANFLGCSAIYTIGLDLAYHQGLNHVKGSRFEEWAINNCHRLDPLANNLFTYLNLAEKKMALNINGKPTASDSRLIFYKSWFEEQSTLLPCYNLSLGLNITGFTNIKLEKASHLADSRAIINSIIKNLS